MLVSAKFYWGLFLNRLDGLLFKLINLNFPDSIISLLHSCLFGRSFKARINKSLSNSQPGFCQSIWAQCWIPFPLTSILMIFALIKLYCVYMLMILLLILLLLTALFFTRIPCIISTSFRISLWNGDSSSILTKRSIFRGSESSLQKLSWMVI